MKKLRVLFLEDCAEDCDIECLELRNGGLEFESHCVGNRDDFVKALKEYEPDLVILDYSLPGMSGLDGLELVRELRPQTPAIFVSGNIGEEKAIECLKRGATDYVLKSRLSGLVFTVRRALKEADQRKELRSLEEQFRQAQKMEAIGRLAGGIAHDFNNMLAGIIGYSDLALRELEEGDPLHEYLTEIRKTGDRAAALTDQLLSFSRKQILEQKLLDLNGVVREVENMLERMIGREYEIVITSDPRLGKIKANQGQVEQVILNLVVNARDAMSSGGKIVIELANFDFEPGETRVVPDMQPGPYVMLAVSDDGRGMDEAVLAHIFEPFFTTKEKGKGTGLGLSTVYGIVKQYGGHVAVKSEPGRGTTFRIYFPRVRQESKLEDTPRIEPPPARGGETILVVDDEDAIRKLMRMILEKAGYNVLVASNGVDALDVSSGYPDRIHLLLTDLVMPKMNGVELASRLAPQRPDMKILLVSGYSDKLADSLSPELALPLVKKPFAPDALLARVRETLQAPRRSARPAPVPARKESP